MKKVILMCSAVLLMWPSFAATSPLPESLNANRMYITVGKNGEKISLMELASISLADMETLKGSKMRGMQKLTFKSTQKKLQKKLNADGSFKSQKFEKRMNAMGGEYGFHLGGFALGFFGGLIGVLIAYVIDDDYKSNRVKWAWIGLGIVVAASVALVVVALNSIN